MSRSSRLSLERAQRACEDWDRVIDGQTDLLAEIAVEEGTALEDGEVPSCDQ